MATQIADPGEWVPRTLDMAGLLKKRSHFLLGPRQTGKTTLVQHSLKGARVYDLLDSSVYLTLTQNPGRLAEELTRRDSVVVIDEIQRLPSLLNEVHRLIETRGLRFLLTGSSARKLRGGGVNLLGGRARVKNLHPFTWKELGDRFDLARAIARGLLPSIYFSDDPSADLLAYAGLYLQQEIVAEGATRNVPAFSRFLKVAALSNATIVNFTNVANDSQVPRTTIYEYFEILKDTLVVHELKAWRKTVKRKPLASSKYYFFDVGVVGALQGRAVRRGTPEFGPAFETYLMHELTSYSDYVSGEPLGYWRSTSGFEVDFISSVQLTLSITNLRRSPLLHPDPFSPSPKEGWPRASNPPFFRQPACSTRMKLPILLSERWARPAGEELFVTKVSGQGEPRFFG